MLLEQRRLILQDGRELEYYIDRGKRRNIYLSVKEGKVILKLPMSGCEERGEQFLREKADWALRSLANKPTVAKPPVTFSEGESFTLAGEEYIITCLNTERYEPPRFENGRLLIFVPRDYDSAYVSEQARKALEQETLEIIHAAFARLTLLTGLYPKKVSVKKMTASWGRCSSNGSISINSAVVFYPPECIDYVIIHELCHLRHMDHSAAFWELVSRFCPDWKRIRKSMK